MKKRISIIIVFCLILSLFPAYAFAGTESDYDAAVRAVQTATAQVTQTKAALDKANADLAAANKKKTDTATALKNANNAVAVAEAERDAAFANAKTNADTDVSNKQKAYDKAVSDQKTAQSNYNSAKAAYDKAVADNNDEAKIAAADQKIADAEDNLSTATQELEEAQDTYDNSGRVFLEDNTAGVTLEELTAELQGSRLSEYVNTDTYNKAIEAATSIDNIKKSLSFIKLCNDLRKAEGKSELKISSALMLTSIASNAIGVQCYASDQHAAFLIYRDKHGAYLISGENVTQAINDTFGSGFSPYDLWYTDEKQIYDANNGPVNNDTQTTGHYENIVNSDYNSTGFSWYLFKTNRAYAVQDFGYSSDAVTVSSFEAQLDAFVASASDNLTSAKKILAEAESSLTKAKDEKTTLEKSLAENTEVANAKSALDKAESAKAQTDKDVTAAKSALDQAKALQAKAGSIDASKPATYSDFPELVAAVKKVDDAIKARDDAEAKANAATKDAAAKEQAAKAAQADYNNALKAKEEAEKVLAGIKIPASAITVTVKNAVYNGKAQKPAITATYNGQKITDYTASYSSNKAIGQAAVKITFSGNAEGTKTVTFNILPPTAKIKAPAKAKAALTVKWTKFSKANQKLITGFQIQASKNKSFSGAKTVTAKKTLASKKVTKLARNTTYYVRVRSYAKVKGKTIYSNWSAVKSVKTK